MTEASEVLARHPLFSALNERQRTRLEEHAHVRSYYVGGEVAGPDARPVFLVVISGELEVAGGESPLRLRPDDHWGALQVLRDEAPAGSVRAVTEAEVLIFARQTFLAMVNGLPGVGLTLLKGLAARPAPMPPAPIRTEPEPAPVPSVGNSSEVVPFARISDLDVDPAVAELVPRPLIEQLQALPVRLGDRVATVAMVEPFNPVAVDRLRAALKGARVERVAVGKRDFDAYCKQALSPATTEGAGPRRLPPLQKTKFNLRFVEEDVEREEDQATRVPGGEVVALVNQLLGEALEYDASDIHIAPEPEHLSVRYRIDGQLMTRANPVPLHYYAPLMSRLKVLSRMDITDKRKPQDGRIAITRGGRELDFRTSTVPTRFGEKMVMRVLDRSAISVGMDRIVAFPDVAAQVKAMVEEPFGIIVVSGPTGSGKTTTLYSAVMHRLDEGINIATIEDPIEYTILGLTQLQVNPSVGLGFAEATRAMLRQDPDIIMVGETRDAETARAALTAALTGHLVLTSVHANGSLSTLVRLRDMGIEPYLIANATVGVVYQRLLRRICPDCREPHEYPDALLRRIRPAGAAGGEVLYHGRGCHHCNGSGFRGRLGAFEVLRVDEELRNVISVDADMKALRHAAVRGGFRPIQDYCYRLVCAGLTTPHDALSILTSG